MITADVIKHSITYNSNELITFKLRYPRIIHSELMTHRMFSRNASSSRAVPVQAQIQQILDDTACPSAWGLNNPGMQSNTEGDAEEGLKLWYEARDSAIKHAQRLHDMGFHKQIVNRVLEPYTYMNVILSATDMDNFYYLRCDDNADPTIADLAYKMRTAHEKSKPILLNSMEWHIPFTNYIDGEYTSLDYKTNYTLDEALLISVSCCAQVSYRKEDCSVDKAHRIHTMLISSDKLHASPFEHQAAPFQENVRVDNEYCRNFKGWIQYRTRIEQKLELSKS